MKIKLSKHVLVGDADVTPTRPGTIVEVSAEQGAEFVRNGLAEEVKAGKAARAEESPAPQEQDALATRAAAERDNKMAGEAENKTSRKKSEG